MLNDDIDYLNDKACKIGFLIMSAFLDEKQSSRGNFEA